VVRIKIEGVCTKLYCPLDVNPLKHEFQLSNIYKLISYLIKTLFVLVMKGNLLILCKKIIGVCSNDHKKRINVFFWQKLFLGYKSEGALRY